MLGIHKALRLLFDSEAEGLRWLREPRAALPFAGQSPFAPVPGDAWTG